jgi:hypothetical protein
VEFHRVGVDRVGRVNVVYDENVNVLWFTPMKNDVYIRRERFDLFRQVFLMLLGEQTRLHVASVIYT